ncbi:MAG TPA: hypothetical protein VGM44_15415 [Polyangiaceae bacterium]|jgi:hypothetical protein
MRLHFSWLVLSTVLAACGGSSAQDSNQAHAGSAGMTANEAGSAGAGGSLAASGASGTSGSGSGGTQAGSASGGIGGASNGGAGGNISNGGASAGASGTAGAAAATIGCAGWQVDIAQGDAATAEIQNGKLVLAHPANTVAGSNDFGGDIALVQDGLTGDFDVTLNFEDFVPGDAKPFVGPRLVAQVRYHDPSGSIYSAGGTVGSATGQASVVHQPQFTINSLDPSPAPSSFVGASGSFHIQRASNEITVTTTVNGQTVTAQSTTPFPEQPLTLLFFLDDGEDAGLMAPQAYGATVSKVTVVGGGGTVKSDDFSCP